MGKGKRFERKEEGAQLGLGLERIGPTKKPKGPVKITEISQHFTKLTPEGLRSLEKIFPEGATALDSYKNALQVQDAIERDNHRINRMEPEFLQKQLGNPFLGLVHTRDPAGQVVKGRQAYQVVRNALGESEKRKKVKLQLEQTTSELQQITPGGVKRADWLKTVDNFKKTVLKEKLGE